MTNEERIKADAEAYMHAFVKGSVKYEDIIPNDIKDAHIAGATAVQQRAQVLVDALEELIQLKKIKDELGKTTNYLARQPEAWKRAIAAIEQWKSGKGKEVEQVATICKLSTEEKKKLLANKIEARMKEVGLQRQEFADLMGTQPSTITRWLSGEHNFQIETLFEIEKQLNISLFKY